MYKQLQGVIGANERVEAEEQVDIYPKFATMILDLVRDMRKDIDPNKEVENAKFKLKDGVDADVALEKLSDIMRELLFFETMGARNQKSSEIEAKLFGTLSTLDDFVSENLQDGEEHADRIRDELGAKFNALRG